MAVSQVLNHIYNILQAVTGYRILVIYLFFSQVSGPLEFGNSWVASPETCPSLPQEIVDPCNENSESREEAESLCGQLIDENGKM